MNKINRIMNELETAKIEFLATLARDIYIKLIEKNQDISCIEMKALATLSHEYADKFLDVQEQWLESRYSRMKQSDPSIVTPIQYFQDYNSDIFMGGNFNA